MSRVPRLACCGIAALAAAAVSQLGSPELALGLAVAAVPLLARVAPPSHLAALAIAVRSFLPEMSLPLEASGMREALSWPLLASLPQPDAFIAVGSLLGGKAELPRELRDAFARTGTTHLLAASGFNITLVAGALGAALRPAGPRATAAGTIAAAFAMAVAAGLAPSIVRAALMSLAASVAVFVGRPSGGIGALGVAVVALLLASPRTIGDVGFLLSITATAGLLLLARPLEHRLPGPPWFRAQLATTGAATLASLPISAEAFGRISLVSPVANLALAPLVPPLMTATGIAMAAGAVSMPLAFVPAWVAYALARTLRGIVELAASLPAASISLPHAGGAVLAVYAVGLVAMRLPRTRTLVAGVVATAVAVSVAAALISAGDSRDRIIALDVGQGDAFLLQAGEARALIDAGPEPPRTLRSLASALAPGTSHLDVVVLTHSHADHEAGFAAVLDRYGVGLALEPIGLEPNAAASEWHDALARHGVPVRALARGDRVRIGDLMLDAMAPLGDPADPLPNLVLRARVGPMTALFLGDASEREQEDLLLQPAELRADIYVPPHHGAATPHAGELVRAVQPSVALISVGAGNRYGHPTPETLRALSGVRTLRTDRDGTLDVLLDGDILRCATRTTALPRPWDGWLSRPPPCA